MAAVLACIAGVVPNHWLTSCISASFLLTDTLKHVNHVKQINERIKQCELELECLLKKWKNLSGKHKTLESIKELRFQDLRKNVRNTTSDVKRYLNLGWIGLCEILCEQDWSMDNVMEIWDKFHLFLLRLQHLFQKSEQVLTMWEKMLYLFFF